MNRFVSLLLLLFALSACQVPDRQGEGAANKRIVRENTNLEVCIDSVQLELLPVKDSYISLYKGSRVVVAEFEIHPEDSIDSIWVKVAHSQEMQGWISQSRLTESFVPVDSISQFIYLFSHSHLSYFIVIIALFAGAFLFRVSRKRPVKLVYINDIDSVYPLLLCLLLAVSATLYESIQVFAPATWQYFYFNPTLSPFQTSPVLSAFLISIWLVVLVTLAAFDDLFSQLPSQTAFLYLLGLLSCCIFCYFFFTFTTRYYVGYLFLALFIWAFVRRVKQAAFYRYRCGICNGKMRAKGVCPHCGAINK